MGTFELRCENRVVTFDSCRAVNPMTPVLGHESNPDMVGISIVSPEGMKAGESLAELSFNSTSGQGVRLSDYQTRFRLEHSTAFDISQQRNK